MRIDETVEGRERYPVSVRYARSFREDPGALRRVLVATPTGAQESLGQVAELSFETGSPMVRSEDGRLVAYVFVDTGDRAIADYVAEAREVVAEEVDLPAGVRHIHTHSLTEVAIILLAVPFSLVGAIWLLCLLGFHMSVAVWVGIIALAGIDAETGIVMLLYLKLAFNRWRREGRLRSFADLTESIVEGAARRIRPKLMTVMVLFLGLMPLMGSTGTGADVMKRIAAPMVGGIVTSFLLQLTVYPAVFAVWKGRAVEGRTREEEAS